ncbi:hypothetical protein AWC38_SpisGene9708 [Stylophora pistillata]|uniref:Uncharacterized protein n=1 Tax=Stylophora pistillata TaxID=50429 RepID=A0A2B4S9E5_STYPI|nr:hypothetical protein AWC38_SpisGene9708 [Stylophora pistillata]
MAHLYSGRQIPASRPAKQEAEFQSYPRSFPQFDLNSRAVKLPPIIKNELLVGRSIGHPSPISTASNANGHTSFPKISETTNETVPRRQKTKSLRVTVKHVEKAPTNYPNSYKVLPPIGQSNVWRPYNKVSSTRSILNAPKSNQDKINGQRRSSSQRKCSDNGLSPSPKTRFAENQRIYARNDASRQEDGNRQQRTFESRIERPPMKTFDTVPEQQDDHFNHEFGEKLPSVSNEDVEVTPCEGVHELEKLEVSKDVVEFLAR